MQIDSKNAIQTMKYEFVSFHRRILSSGRIGRQFHWIKRTIAGITIRFTFRQSNFLTLFYHLFVVIARRRKEKLFSENIINTLKKVWKIFPHEVFHRAPSKIINSPHSDVHLNVNRLWTLAARNHYHIYIIFYSLQSRRGDGSTIRYHNDFESFYSFSQQSLVEL